MADSQDSSTTSNSVPRSSKGYAAAATDTGHIGSPIDAAWALGHPEKVIDFGHRGIHEMTRVAKLVVQQFYGSAPKHSYFAGCSDGGREALMEAQRYPGRLRRNSCRSACKLLDRPALDVSGRHAGSDRDSGQLHSAGKDSHHRQLL